ncbi:MAG: hydantoinase B/oxoprolinase family protein, partial [Candidatus Thorarchaeota archaeon]
MSTLDPVTERVLANAFVSTCSEMGITMINTANSGIFVEGRDFSCAILDDQAELVATANFDPSHLSAMALTSEYALMDLGYEDLADGDVILINDPYRGGGHLTDISLIRPIFYKGELLGIAMNRAHHIDIGGMAVAGFPGTAESIFQEGLRIPPVKWFRAGEEQQDVMELITLNVRFQQDQLGDFRAQLASTFTAKRRLEDLCEKYGVEIVRQAMQRVKDHSEALMQATIREIPDGVYQFDEIIDDDGVSGESYRIHVTLTVEGDGVVVDFTGTSSQAKGPVNSSYGNTLSATFNSMLQVIGPDVLFNHGCFRPIHLIVPRGTFLNPLPPAPVFGGVTEVSIRIIDVITGALAQAVPHRVCAATYGTCQNFAGGGFDDVRGEDFGFYFFTEGGWGATAWRDGWNVTANQTSNVNDYPVETIERDFPLQYMEVKLYEGSAGAGQYRGGVGSVRTMKVLCDELHVNALSERHKVKPFGLAGGLPGEPNALLLKRARGDGFQRFDEVFPLSSPSKFANIVLKRGD